MYPDYTEKMTALAQHYNYNYTGRDLILAQLTLLHFEAKGKPFTLELYAGQEFDDPRLAVFKFNTEMLGEGGLSPEEEAFHRIATYLHLIQACQHLDIPVPEQSLADFVYDQVYAVEHPEAAAE